MNNPRILVVEDEKVIAEDIQHRLSGLGYEVAGVACDAKEGLALVESLKPNLVLMDINMGGNSAGIEAAESIRKLHHVPVVFLSGYSEGEMLERALKVNWTPWNATKFPPPRCWPVISLSGLHFIR